MKRRALVSTFAGTVQVAENVHDLGKVKIGDALRIDFVPPGNDDEPLRAATVWPAR